MLQAREDYARTCQDFSWTIPAHYNIGTDVCDRWADGSGRLALIVDRGDSPPDRYTFDQLKRWSDELALALRARGVEPGDRVGILLPQSLETALSHLAVYKLGAIAVPLFTLFGTDALQYRLGNSGARALVTHTEGMGKIAAIRDALPELRCVLNIDAARQDENAFWGAIESQQGNVLTPHDTLADDPAVIIYTSGTTGKPKGALHAHRMLLGHLPGVEISHNFFPDRARLMWTPADWAWIGGLMDVLMPSWHHGVAVLAHRFGKFDAEQAWRLMARHQVSHTFLPPTALKMLRALDAPERYGALRLVSVASGGETLGAQLIDWGRKTLGVTINEFYGQTECNMIVSSCSALFEPRAGAMGRPVPGHDVRIIDERGQVVPDGTEGHIAVRRPDPVMFLQYWANPRATADAFIGEFLVTGDRGMRDADGYLWFKGRGDDVITSAGYRIGPGPIEDCLISHPAVRMAAVIGVPDPERTEIVKACIVLKEGFQPSAALIAEIQDHVRRRAAAHEYPRLIEFMDALPMTTTGKVIRKALRDLHQQHPAS
ncbi:acyl-CoA synthetase [uncultured Castellaniella sp.]|uniref:acyl-CoA synthetase n=1 Tax=uncultured Castellaniella sp. TaxID=647907 RepID=UPI002637274D|nr:acyl-CoA synthetase [uncultured Castellaniella sp.]